MFDSLHARLTKLTCTAAIVFAASSMAPLHGTAPPSSFAGGESTVVAWNAALLQAVRETRMGPTIAARSLAIVHTCMYEAWVPYDGSALGTIYGNRLKRPPAERTEVNKTIAISSAAYRALVDLFPSREPLFVASMVAQGLDPHDASTDASTPQGIGNRACGAVLESRRFDGANQRGEMNGGLPYSDYTSYTPINTPELLLDPNRWQPLRATSGTAQVFLTPQWSRVTPFALRSAGQFRPPPPPLYPNVRYAERAEEIRTLSAELDDRRKVIAEYWADGPGSETPPGHWIRLAEYVSRRDSHGLDADVRMFFALSNALLDASIAVWDSKLAFDYVRPISAIRFLRARQAILAWGGPYQGTRSISGELFRSYLPTPPFAEYVSGHSAFSAAAATVLLHFTGKPHFGAQYTFGAGTSAIEPGLTPARDVTLHWKTFDEAAEEAAMSRRYGGIHFRDGDLDSRILGRRVALQTWRKSVALFSGRPRE